ncbi:MAG: tetratricopeptide repeat protein [Bacteroidia bacterium]
MRIIKANYWIALVWLITFAACNQTSVEQATSFNNTELEQLSTRIISDPSNLPSTEAFTGKFLSRLAAGIIDSVAILSNNFDSTALNTGRQIFKNRGTNIFYEALGSEILSLDYFIRWEIDSSIYYGRYAESAYKLLQDTLGIGRLTFLSGLCYEQQQDLSNAFLVLNKALDLFKAEGDSNRIAETLVEISFILIRSEQLDKGLELLLSVKKYADSHPDYQGSIAIYKLLAETYYFRNELSQAKKAAFRALELCSNGCSDQDLAFLNNQIGIIYMAEGRYEESVKHLNETCRLKLNEENNDACLAFYNLGKTYFKWGKVDSAKIILNKSLELGAANPYMLINQQLANQLLTDIYKKEGEFGKALETLEQYHIYKDSLEKTQNKEQVARMQLENENAERTAQLKASEKEQNYNRILNRILILLGFIVTSILVLIIMRILKASKMRNEASQDRLNLAMRELETNRRMLAEFRSNLIGRNIDVIKNYPEESSEGENEPHQQLDSGEITESISGLENLRLLTQEDWLRFSELLEDVYPGLRKKIAEKVPGLTPGEERIFLLICIKTENKDISAILGISPASVRKAKYRLKQKLNLDSETVLEKYIQDIIK